MAFGEHDEEEGVFLIPPGGVLEEGTDVDVGGLQLGTFDARGGLLSVGDLDMAELDFDFDDDLNSEWEEVEAPLPTAEDDWYAPSHNM